VLSLQGTTYVYGTFFKPYISQHENEIDRNLLEPRARATDTAVLYFQKAASAGQSTFSEICFKICCCLVTFSEIKATPSSGVDRMHYYSLFCQKNPLNHLLFSVHHVYSDAQIFLLFSDAILVMMP
jgi:hypothetical protein